MIVSTVAGTVLVLAVGLPARLVAGAADAGGGGDRAGDRAVPGARDDLAAARDGGRGVGDGARRLRAPRDARPRATRSASWRARSTRWRPSWPTSTACGATSWRTSRTSCGRRSARCRRCWRTSSTASSRSIPAALRTALVQTERLGRLVEQLLDLSRLESGALALRPAPFPVRSLLEQATRECELGETFTSRPVWLRVSVQPGDLRAIGDAERMHQVISNLLENAVRHSPTDGRVWLSAHAATDGVTTIEVADEGPGHPGRRGRARLRALPPRRRGPRRPRRRHRPRPRHRALDRRRPRRHDRRPRAGAARLPRRRGAPEMNEEHPHDPALTRPDGSPLPRRGLAPRPRSHEPARAGSDVRA